MVSDSPHINRPRLVHIDGTPIFRDRVDAASEKRLSRIVADAFRCEIHEFGALSPLDWFATRDGRLIGVLELKTRPAASSEVANQLISVRKWLSLTLASVGMGVPAVFAVEFTDGVRWSAISDLPNLKAHVGGRNDRPNSPGAREPVFYIPLGCLKPL